MKSRCLPVLLLFLATLLPASADVVCDKVAPVVPDVQAMQSPDAVQLSGWLGSRINGNEKVRLLNIDLDVLLAGYRQRPGDQDWVGEHIGKWLHAATLAWVHNHDAALRAKLDFAVAELIKCQLPDGYLGTYSPEQYWTSWDLWSHKYNLIGLITYMRYTGNLQPLEACKKMADLVCRTYGDGAGQKTIIDGPYDGLANGSILEPMALLYRLTGEKRYLEFCHYIIRAFEQPAGPGPNEPKVDSPRIVSTLLAGKGVYKVGGHAKAYEMLSCINGLLEFYRTTGERPLLDASLAAWKDIVEKRLYPTGTASSRELFTPDHEQPNTEKVGETCVTVTWLQLNAQLLRLTGEARFAQELEKLALNQLIGAQTPNCDAWGYYVEMEGKRPNPFFSCCNSSGPRGLALLPTFATSTDADGVVVNLYESGIAKVTLNDHRAVTIKTETKYPGDGRVGMTITPEGTGEFAVKLRVPAWTPGAPILVNGETQAATPGADGYVALRRAWQAGDRIELAFAMSPRILRGERGNTGRLAFAYGPLVLAADEMLLPEDGSRVQSLFLDTDQLSELKFTPEPAPGKFNTWPGAQVFGLQAGLRRTVGETTTFTPVRIRLAPFAEAGSFGGHYQVWLRLKSSLDENVLVEGEGQSSGSDPSFAINDGYNGSAVNLSLSVKSGEKPAPQWFGVGLYDPVTVRRVTFAHGDRMKWGGWFDAANGKPVIEIQREKNGPWIKAGELEDYPATTATEKTPELPTAVFTYRFDQPETITGVRVIGMPSRPRNAGEYAVSGAELQAFIK